MKKKNYSKLIILKDTSEFENRFSNSQFRQIFWNRCFRSHFEIRKYILKYLFQFFIYFGFNISKGIFRFKNTFQNSTTAVSIFFFFFLYFRI